MFDRVREILWLTGVGVVGIALFGFLVVVDTGLVVNALERSGSSTLAAVVIGTAAALGTVLAAVWYRRRVDHLGGAGRRVLGSAGIAWGALFVLAFFLTHPKGRDDEDAGALEVAVVSYVLVILLAAVGFLPLAVRRLTRGTPHQPDSRIRVWRMRDKKPYFVASCDCGWVGTAYDATEPHAREKAFRDARQHGPNVASEAEDPLG
jgi:peptidoglycan/LPS O-acetylase OafA/YrhL